MSRSDTIAHAVGLALHEPRDLLVEFDDHEAVLFVQDKASDLKGYIAIHNTNRGPANGGTRYFTYASEQDALRDALRLSRAMSYKSALANLPYGGGKAVIMASIKTPKRDQLISYAKRLALMGRFYTGEDVGLDAQDIQLLASHCDRIVGRPGVGEMPAHWAALSVFVSMKATMKAIAGKESLKGKTVAIKGLGNVGRDLAGMLAHAGAKVVAADTSDAQVARALVAVPDIEIVAPQIIASVGADIYAPCAMGSELTRDVIDHLGAPIVCGSANNQLPSPAEAGYLHHKNITYVPDYVANAGGLICVSDELHPGGFSRKRVQKAVEKIGDTVIHILREAQRLDTSTETVATMIGRERIYGTIESGVKLQYE